MESDEKSAVRHFMIGPDQTGLWIVCDAEGSCGAVFVNRDEALHFANAEREALRPAPTELSFVAAMDWRAMFGPKRRRVARSPYQM